jgi:hypothetical protein
MSERVFMIVGNVESVACNEFFAVLTISAWHLPHALSGLVTEGSASIPLWALSLLSVDELPP